MHFAKRVRMPDMKLTERVKALLGLSDEEIETMDKKELHDLELSVSYQNNIIRTSDPVPSQELQNSYDQAKHILQAVHTNGKQLKSTPPLPSVGGTNPDDIYTTI